MKAEDYTHRIGRTGRAGRDGLAVTFAEFRDRRKIFDIEGWPSAIQVGSDSRSGACTALPKRLVAILVAVAALAV